MKKLITLLLLILTLNVNGQILYNKYTVFNPYYGKSQTYTNQKYNDGRDKRFELGVLVMGVGMVIMLVSTYSYTSYNYYGYVIRQTNYPMFYTGLGLTTTGLIISLFNSKKKRKRNKLKDSEVFYE